MIHRHSDARFRQQRCTAFLKVCGKDPAQGGMWTDSVAEGIQIGSAAQPWQNSCGSQQAKKAKCRPQRLGKIQEQEGNADEAACGFPQARHDKGQTISGLARSKDAFHRVAVTAVLVFLFLRQMVQFLFLVACPVPTRTGGAHVLCKTPASTGSGKFCPPKCAPDSSYSAPGTGLGLSK